MRGGRRQARDVPDVGDIDGLWAEAEPGPFSGHRRIKLTGAGTHARHAHVVQAIGGTRGVGSTEGSADTSTRCACPSRLSFAIRSIPGIRISG
jgi:hypothetical protein